MFCEKNRPVECTKAEISDFVLLVGISFSHYGRESQRAFSFGELSGSRKPDLQFRVKLPKNPVL